jgi:PTS system N-acetylgalactosamine-specific IIA component
VKIMSDASGVRALVAGHGDFAAGLISAVEAVTGRGELLEPIQVMGLCGEDIQQLLRERLHATGALVIFTDLQAGSCTMAARRLLRDQPSVLLVSGANLPMLLDFVMSTTPDPLDAARAAVERARSAIAAYGGPA